MAKQTIDFLKQLSEETQHTIEQFSPQRKRTFFTWGRTLGAVFSFVLLLGLAYSTKAVISTNAVAEQFGNATVFEQIKHLVSNDDKPLAGEEENRINVLLLGTGGEKHEGGNLTDTIILASIAPKDNAIALLSIPRDLVVPIPQLGWQKINAAHAYGAAWYPDTKGAGAELAKQTVTAITGQDIDYYVKIDFAGFVKIINAIGGVRLYVPNSFTDYQYPDNNYGYEPVQFNEGWQNFDGDTALKYARSRHGTNNEGSDFARARRQQAILQAVQTRVGALSTLLNPNKMLSLADIVSTHVETDMEIWESLRLLELGQKVDPSTIKQYVLSSEENGLLYVDTNEDGAYLLRPQAGADDFSEISMLATHLLEEDPYSHLAPPASEEPVRIAIHNGTSYPGLAARIARTLDVPPYTIVEIGNAEQRDYEKTVVYALTEHREKDVAYIRETLDANVSPTLPSFVLPLDADILIIVGSDATPEESLSLR